MPLLLSSFRSSFSQFNNSTIQQFNIFLIYFILCFSPLIEGGTTYYPVAIIQFLLLIILAGGIYSFYHGSQYLSLKSPLFYIILFFLGYAVLIAFLTPYKLPAFQQIQLFFFYFILFYFSILYFLTHDQYQKNVINIFYLMGLFEAIVGSVQYFGFHQRARGTFFNPDFFGEYLAIIFCIALGLILEDGRKRSVIASETKQSGLITLGLPRTIWALAMTNRLVSILSLLLLATGIFLSQSRGAALAWGVGISFVLWRRFKVKVVYAWLALFLLFSIIPNPLQHRFLHDYREDTYSLSRFDMWEEAIHIIRDHPMGIGIEMYPLISPQYAFPIESGLQRYSKVAESPHNDYFRLFAETGAIGGLFFIAMIFLFFKKWIDKTKNPFLRAGILGGIIIFLVHALVDSNFHEPALVITVIILSTLLLDKRLFNLSSYPSPLIPHPSRFTFYFSLFTFSILLGVMVVKPAIGWYFYSKGYAQIKNHQEDTAQLNYKKAIFGESQNARYHNALANVYFNTFEKTNYYGWVFKALEELNQALRLNPIDGNNFKLKGEIYQALAVRERNPANIQELYDSAFTNYEKAIKLLPYDASLYVALGSVEEASGKTENAENHYNQAILIEPNYLFAREKKIELLFKKGQKEAALKSYQELFSVYDRTQKLAISDAEKAFIYFNQEKLEKAVEEAK